MSDKQMIAMVTGASSGLGAEYCRQLASRCKVIIAVARRADRLESLREELAVQTEIVPVAADLATVEGVTLATEALRQKGPVDLLVNNAGISAFGPYTDAGIDDQLRTVRVNIDALLVLSRAALPFMREAGGGTIVNVASIGAFLPMKDTAVYGASKAFVHSFSESLQNEVRADNIQVQCVCPGMTRTEIHDSDMFAGFDKTKVPDELWMSADEVVAISLNALDENAVTLVTGDQNVAMARAAALATVASIQ